FVPQKELSREHVYWLPAEELATQKSNPPKPVTPFVYTRPAPSKYEQCVLEKKKLQIEKKNLLIQSECLITDCIAKDIFSIMLASDRDRPLSEELSSNCVRENSSHRIAKSDKRCSFIQKNHIDLQIKFRNYKECLKNQMIGDNSHSRAVNAVFEINQLKEQLQGKDDTIKKLQTKINSMSMLNIEPTVGMYAISSKYIVPPRRVNRAEPPPLPKKNQATFQEPLDLQIDPYKKTVVQQNKKPNIHVNLSTGVNPATGASKPMSKSDTRNHSILPAKREKAKRVEDHHRNLNKQNHVDSRLNVKHTGFVSNSNTICNACNKSLFFANHDNCVVRNLKSVNVKTPTVVQIVLWYLDSGCSRHMTDDRSKLTNYVDKFIGTVRFENDQFAAIVGYGDYKLGNTIISRVYYVEGLSHNLFSVGQFCDGGLKVAFRKHTCKSKKSSHPLKTVNTNTKILNTLHMDLYGPMRIESMNKKKYILVIVDDYTKFGWVRFLRTKDETPELIKKFIVTTQRALNAIVRYVRTDNGTEFVNKTLTEFFESAGITHNTSMNVKADIGIFVGYAPTKKAYRIFSKRTSLEPNTMAPVYNGAGPEISTLQSGRTHSDLKHSVRINAAQAPEIATGSPSTTIIIESAPAVFTTSSESQTLPPDTSVTGIETPFHTCDNNVFEPYIASEASSSNTLNVKVTLNSPIAHMQK
nr:integrase, catalytic region, zinc finger, CCHC-type, peptidase aspartic, catalytic [Tanacetum cinerariifolium]